ncbi:conserved exported hypothetical protein [Sphingomonas sp. AX6]|nr:conserved exported hypothetical protein [Sphingomonas sp. AX6]
MIAVLKTFALAAPAALLALASPAGAQDMPYTPGTYWEVASIDVEDGMEPQYIDFLAGQWRKSQEFAKSKGYITDYHVLTNMNPRDGEPDLYLVTEFERMYDTAEQLRQQREYEAMMKRTERQLMGESGARGKMRTLKGSMLLRELTLSAR